MTRTAAMYNRMAKVEGFSGLAAWRGEGQEGMTDFSWAGRYAGSGATSRLRQVVAAQAPT